MARERILVYEGEPGVSGTAVGPFGAREGMNRFPGNPGVAFRRDHFVWPRINRPGSYLDRGQKVGGDYYYYTAGEDEAA